MIASLSWIARQIRPALSYRVSRLQARVNQATVLNSRDCNHVRTYAKETGGVGICFCSTGLGWGDLMVCTITDASFCDEVNYTTDGKHKYRSRQGYDVALASPDVLSGQTRRYTQWVGAV